MATTFVGKISLTKVDEHKKSGMIRYFGPLLDRGM